MFELITSARFGVDHAVGRAHVGADWPPVADHFRGAPVLPGSVQIELCAQIAGPLAERALKAHHGVERWAFLAMVRSAMFQLPVHLPATLELRAALTRYSVDPVAGGPPSHKTAKVEATLGGEEMCRAELVFMMVAADATWAAAIADARARVARWEQT
jgi:3-hydroxymyristoyl/3-hydroxydecanoyl-(acyl carrier protein) dehydratase